MPKPTLLKKLACFCFALSLPVVAQNNFKLPDLGTSAVQVLSIEKERAVGDVMMMQIRGTSRVLQDPVLDEYLTNIGNRLVAHADDIRFPFEFFWIDNNDINAFAFYGGHVGVHTGLIINADNESQLASVVGHEIAHVTQRHLARRLQKARDNQGLTIAGMIAGILTTMVAPDAGMAILAASQTQSQLSQLTHSRGAEQEADRIGMQILNNAGFDPRESSEFLSKLADQLRHMPKPPAFLLTHPLPDSRVSDVRMRALQYPERFIDSSIDFSLAKARVIARYGQDSDKAEQEFRKYLRINRFAHTTAAEYGLAITLIDQKKYNEAANLLTALEKKVPGSLFILDAQTDLLLGQEKYEEALRMLKAEYQRQPNNQVVTLNYANAAITAGELDLANKLLKYFLLEKPDHVLGKELLAKTYKEQDDKASYHELRASIFTDYGAYSQASNEVQKALNHVDTSDDIKQQRLKARLKEYRLMQKELAKL
ncbi:beta-barrel assembly-enhancing protease [Pseudoalteromonas piratica]|uniref:Putative beta-barrel assembly-enhancing protease n=1 Tax=Pseudoalteromonas piratica TaxID=1348114 RepID=A0A0A7EI85_9GAMM|nr:M48 family metalloprotease [Pseudoalteromonas piratica]AIY65776.1 protease [Pseudoalteromonas piratica]